MRDHDLFECSTTSFSLVYGMTDTEVTDEMQFRYKGTLNEALEYKLKTHSNHVIKYIKKRQRVESAQLEFIMDDKGKLYLIDLSGFIWYHSLGLFHGTSKRIRVQSSKQRRKTYFKNNRAQHEGMNHNLL